MSACASWASGEGLLMHSTSLHDGQCPMFMIIVVRDGRLHFDEGVIVSEGELGGGITDD